MLIQFHMWIKDYIPSFLNIMRSYGILLTVV